MSKHATLLRVLEAVKSKENSKFPYDFWLCDATVNCLIAESGAPVVKKGKLVLMFATEDKEYEMKLNLNNGSCNEHNTVIYSISGIYEYKNVDTHKKDVAFL